MGGGGGEGRREEGLLTEQYLNLYIYICLFVILISVDFKFLVVVVVIVANNKLIREVSYLKIFTF